MEPNSKVRRGTRVVSTAIDFFSEKLLSGSRSRPSRAGPAPAALIALITPPLNSVGRDFLRKQETGALLYELEHLNTYFFSCVIVALFYPTLKLFLPKEFN